MRSGLAEGKGVAWKDSTYWWGSPSIIPYTRVSSPYLSLIYLVLRFWTIYFAYHTQTIIGTASFFYLDPSIRH